MAFLFVKSLGGEVAPLQHTQQVKEGVQILAGSAVSLAEGKATIAVGSTKPRFIAVGDTAAADAARAAGMQDVLPHFIWETTVAASAAALKLGDKVTIHTDGQCVTATSTDGVATILQLFGTEAGSRVWVKFE